MNKNASITIIGGGVVGSAIAYELANDGFTAITVLERNSTLYGSNQSLTNEGTIHSGVYYPKDIMPLKAKLCVEGNALMYEFMEKYNVAYKKVGKLIIATNEQEEEYLNFFLQIGIENKVPGIKKITGEEAKALEPNIANVTSALLVPSAGSTSPKALITKIKELAENNGVKFLFDTTVTKVEAHENGFLITTDTQAGETEMQTDLIINSAGLYSDVVAKMINPETSYEIDPARGEFFQFDKSLRTNIGMNGMHVYQPPYCYTTENGEMKKANIPADLLREKLKEGNVVITAGVHLSPAYDEIDGEYVLKNTVTVSPLKRTGLGKEDYTSNLHPAEDYIKSVGYFFPNLTKEDLQPDHTGIMCPLKGHRDYVIKKDDTYSNCIQLVGIESPGWTASLAIAKYVQNMLKNDTMSIG